MTTTVDTHRSPCPGTDDRTDASLRFLVDAGAAEFPHAHGRTLLDHLVETRRIMARWLQPTWLQDAAAFHSVYSTDVYRRRLLVAGRRDEVAAVIGERAEHYAHLFGTVPRRPLFAAAGELRNPDLSDFRIGSLRLSRADVSRLLILHMANLAEQSVEDDGRPGLWLARVSTWGACLSPRDAAIPPIFDGCRVIITADAERRARAAYVAALAEDDADAKEALLATANDACPWVGEPVVLRMHLALARSRPEVAALWAEQATKRLVKLGVAWDKQRSFEEWLGLAEAAGTALRADHAPLARDAGHSRFHAYIDSFPAASQVRRLRKYPGLASKPWHDPADFPIVTLLEEAYPEIRREIDAMAPTSYHREAERIDRTGAWDVLMFYERGRKHEATCARCPVTASVIEHASTVKTLAGLIYASRLQPHTHIAAHRGPTNMRVRCHLGLRVPRGDCAIRIADHARPWTEGRCIVFDDSFDHEAWNHTDSERVVLIVDLWHPDLAQSEVALLQGLHRYVAAQADGLNRYWSANERARAGAYH